MNELKVLKMNGNNVIDSRNIAAMVEMEHKYLLRKLEGYDSKDKYGNSKRIKGYIEILNEIQMYPVEYFIPHTYIGGNGETRKCYLFTKKGCEFIANKFTGERGVIFTAKYVDAYNEMENALKNIAPHIDKQIDKPTINQLIELSQNNPELANKMYDDFYRNNKVIEFPKSNIDTSSYISSKELAEKLNIYTLHDTPHGKIIDSIAIHSFGWLVNNKPNEINEYFKTELLTETGYPTVYYSPKACLMLEQEFNNIKPIEITPKGLKYNFGGKHNFNVKKRS